jgi:hypothetical protein
MLCNSSNGRNAYKDIFESVSHTGIDVRKSRVSVSTITEGCLEFEPIDINLDVTI